MSVFPDNVASMAEKSEQEIAKRRDEALKRALGMPHKPHKPPTPEKGKKRKSPK